VQEIVGIDRDRLSPAGLGLSLAEAKEITGGIQQVHAGIQVAGWQADQRVGLDCGNRRSLKGHHPIVFRTPFGALRLDSELVRVCSCAKRPTGSVSRLADLLGERVNPEMLYLETKFASLVSYGLTVRLMDEVLPLDRPVGAERVRRHLFWVAEAHEAELASAPTSTTVDERTRLKTRFRIDRCSSAWMAAMSAAGSRDGNAPDAIDDVECLADDVAGALEANPTSVSLRKLATTLGAFATYITNKMGHIVNYGERFRAGERISTGFVESAVNQIADKRFDKRQSMRWTPRGAHLLLQSRIRVRNGDLDQLIRHRHPAFRRPSGNDLAPVL
jgi:hypothetical protein